ncbi:MAG: biopolymer transporter ExbD [Opitutales bacterium]|nr:biopolymer transporter ExbD [Opitutales bacterium]
MSLKYDLAPKRRRKPEINIIPLIDVLVVLIFFFLVSMQFRNLTLLQLTLPDIQTAGREQATEQIEIGITPAGDLFFNGQRVTEAELEARIQEVAARNRTQPVLILADEESLLRSVTFVMDTCRRAGLDRIRLQSR